MTPKKTEAMVRTALDTAPKDSYFPRQHVSRMFPLMCTAFPYPLPYYSPEMVYYKTIMNKNPAIEVV